MSSTFGGINNALTSLYAQRRGLDITGQNIANANTEGYSRQRAEMQAQAGSLVTALYAKSDSTGAGVTVSDVQRLRDEYLETRGRSEHERTAYLTDQAAVYSSIEDVFAEPNDTALQAQLHDMWGAWSDLGNNPKDPAARSALLQQSATVVDGMHDAYETLAGQWSATRRQLNVFADQVNTTASAVAKLNESIALATASGVTVNELHDQRDVHLMNLAELVGGTAYKRDNGAVDVFVGGSPLVSGVTTRKLEVTGAIDLADQMADPLVNPMQIRWADTGTAVTPGGTMGSMADSLTVVIPTYTAALDDVAAKLADTVNAAHSAGYGLDGNTGRPFFSGTKARDLAVAITDPTQIAAAASAGGTLDGSVADSLSATGSSTTGPDGAYREMIAQLGITSQTIGRRSGIQSNVTDQVDAARQSESGVNLDEEMTNMIKYQRGYEAASRVLTTVDEMLDQLINRTGLVGR
jgi:flagellar hook-associated protein 1 FlgK